MSANYYLALERNHEDVLGIPPDTLRGYVDLACSNGWRSRRETLGDLLHPEPDYPGRLSDRDALTLTAVLEGALLDCPDPDSSEHHCIRDLAEFTSRGGSGCCGNSIDATKTGPVA
jgi:hypothetical protein